MRSLPKKSSEPADKIVQEDLGAPAGETFGSFEPDPFAACILYATV